MKIASLKDESTMKQHTPQLRFASALTEDGVGNGT
jgi:hypothetical protein